MKENQVTWNLFPYHMVAYLESTAKPGRIFNNYEVGGFLIYMLSPDSKVFIDGRTNILYPASHYRSYLRAKRDPGYFQEIAESQDIDYAVLNTSDHSVEVMQQANWSLDFVDYRYLLFVPESGELQAFGKLWSQPYCWSSEVERKIADELAAFTAEMTNNRPTTPMMQYVWGFLNAQDKARFLTEYAGSYTFDDAGRRFLAGRALDVGDYDRALSLLEKIESRDSLDDLATVIALGRQEQWQRASEAMQFALNAKRPDQQDPEILERQGTIREWLIANLSNEHVAETRASEIEKVTLDKSASASMICLN
jgi:hypothetical protein